jgi:glutamine amidotransferase
MRVAIVDYGSGNLRSAQKAFERAARDAGMSAEILVTRAPDAVRGAERIVLPGVGAFRDCKQGLAAISGMVEALQGEVIGRGRPFLGICVGMQLMAARGLEHGVTQGLGWIDGEVRRIEPSDPSLKVPHMGWNSLRQVREHALLDGISTGEDGLNAYFVHSYALYPGNPGDLVAETDYGGPIAAIVGRDNLAGTQFHPEKSQKLGLALIANFLRWRP